MITFVVKLDAQGSDLGSDPCQLVSCILRYVLYGLNLNNIWYPRMRCYHHCQGLPL